MARRPLRKRGAGPRVALVGPCGAGKSTIAHHLRALGVEARTPAQEHSGVPDMWQQLLDPDVLVALDAPDAVLRARRPGIRLTDHLLAEQRRRLEHARAHADLHLDTSEATVAQIVARLTRWLAARGIVRAPEGR